MRQLLNVIKRAAIMCEAGRVTPDDLALPGVSATTEEADSLDLRAARERAERTTIVTALARANGNVVKASELLGITRPTLYDLMSKLGIRAER